MNSLHRHPDQHPDRFPARRRRLAAILALASLTGCRHAQQAYDPRLAAPTTGTASGTAAGTADNPAPVSSPAARHNAPAPATPQPDALTLEEAQGTPVSVEIGLASWYGPPYHNHQAADGSIFNQNALTAAHRTLPLGTAVRVTNLATNESVLARITDRGPFIPGRTLDLSLAAARAIGVYRTGVVKVKIEAFAHPTADPDGRWCVQVGVFIDPADALQLKNDLTRRFASARVTEFAGPTGHWVRINPAQPDRSTANRIAESIHLPDAEPYVVRLN